MNQLEPLEKNSPPSIVKIMKPIDKNIDNYYSPLKESNNISQELFFMMKLLDNPPIKELNSLKH